jgi:hypothetical protein
MNAQSMKITLENGSVVDIDPTKVERNPYFERFTKPVRISNSIMDKFTSFARDTGTPEELLISACLDTALKQGWRPNPR